MKFSQNFVAFSKYMNFTIYIPVVPRLVAKINWASLLNPTNMGLKAVVGPE